jgi:hypothetical protein
MKYFEFQYSAGRAGEPKRCYVATVHYPSDISKDEAKQKLLQYLKTIFVSEMEYEFTKEVELDLTIPHILFYALR